MGGGGQWLSLVVKTFARHTEDQNSIHTGVCVKPISGVHYNIAGILLKVLLEKLVFLKTVDTKCVTISLPCILIHFTILDLHHFCVKFQSFMANKGLPVSTVCVY